MRLNQMGCSVSTHQNNDIFHDYRKFVHEAQRGLRMTRNPLLTLRSPFLARADLLCVFKLLFLGKRFENEALRRQEVTPFRALVWNACMARRRPETDVLVSFLIQQGFAARAHTPRLLFKVCEQRAARAWTLATHNWNCPDRSEEYALAERQMVV